MQMMKKISNFIENYNGAFFVGSLVKKEIIYINKKAKKIFGVTVENCDFTKILGISNERIEFMMEMTLEAGRNSMLYNYSAIKKDGEKILVDLQIGYFDEENTEVFLELIPQNDTRMQMALNHIDNSTRAEAILNLDDRLSIVHCNKAFHEVFDSNEELRHSHFQNDLVNGFLPESRQQLIDNILKTLETEPTFSTKIKVFSAIGEEKWYLFELEKRTLDNSGDDKIMAFMTNIEKQVELEENYEYINQFFDAVQSFTDDIVYRIDIKTMELNYLIPVEDLNDKVKPFGNTIPDYINNLVNSNIIHPDDQQAYRDFASENFKGNRRECVVRFSILNDDYEWYSVKGYNIYDECGRLSKIVGALVNIDEEHKVKQNNSLLNQYLSIMQETTTDILYRVDVETMTLYHFSDPKNSFGTSKVIHNYVQTFMESDIIHEDDKQLYLKNLNEFNNGGSPQHPIRFLIGGRYRWCKVTGKKIFDSQGHLKEVFGALVNVESEKQAKTLSNYFEALQSISKESFYIIDVKNRQLTQKGKVAEELKINGVLPNFPESAVDIIHPDDFERFKDYTYKSYQGIPSYVQIQVITPKGDYQWYELHSQIVYDDDGNVSEVVGKMNNIHSEKTVTAKFYDLNKYFDAMQEFSKDVLYHIDVDTMTLYHSFKSERSEQIGNVIPDYVNYLVTEQIVHPDDQQLYLKKLSEWFVDESVQVDARFSLVTNNYEWYSIKGKKILDGNGNITEIVGTLENIQDQYNIQDQFSALSQYFDAIQELTDDRIFHIDILNRVFRYTDSSNQNHTIVFDNLDFIEKLILQGFISEQNADSYKGFFNTMLTGDEDFEHKIQASVDGKNLEWYKVRTKVIRDEDGNPIEVFGKMENIQKQVDLEQKANFDNLTKALSRQTFEEKIIEDLANSSEGDCNALIFIDIDDFKFINDNFGHKFGDFVLEKFTERMRNCIKKTDLVGRVGGDEFVIYLKGIENGEMALLRANSLLDAMIRPISNGAITHKLGLSIGIAVTPCHGKDLGTLYENADKAVYESKNRGKNTATLYSTDM